MLVLNVQKSNSEHAKVIELVRRIRPDLFLALETDFRWAAALQPLEGVSVIMWRCRGTMLGG